MLAGNVVALLSPLIFIAIFTAIFGVGMLLVSLLMGSLLTIDRQI
jgi:hypothetical protein